MIYCVYEIVNKENGKRYIGSTCHFKVRINRHFNELRQGKHHSFLFQEDFDIFGEDVFEVHILEDGLNEQDARKKEELLINAHYTKLYNISKSSSCGDLISYHPKREEIVDNLSSIMKHRYKENPELRKKYSKMFSGENNPMYHHIYTQETRNKMSISAHNKKCSEETKKRLSEIMKKRWQNPDFAKKISMEQKERWKDEKLRENNSKISKERWKNEEYRQKVIQKLKEANKERTKKVFGDGVIYDSVSEAAHQNNLKIGSIINRCRKDSFPNWYYI